VGKNEASPLAPNNWRLWPEQHSQQQGLGVFLGQRNGDRGRGNPLPRGPVSDPPVTVLQGLSPNSLRAY
jgi:hypothetical protein